MAIGFGVLLLGSALARAGGAIWLAYPLRRRVDQLSGDVNSLQVALDQLRAEVADLRAAADVVPVPPLPKTRSADLDDLRQRLRAAHTESEDKSEEQPPKSRIARATSAGWLACRAGVAPLILSNGPLGRLSTN